MGTSMYSASWIARLVYFMSTYQGYSANAPVYRNLPSGGQSYLASADIHWYNTNMNAMAM